MQEETYTIYRKDKKANSVGYLSVGSGYTREAVLKFFSLHANFPNSHYRVHTDALKLMNDPNIKTFDMYVRNPHGD